MPCFRPLKGYRSKSKTENGKRAIVFKASLGLIDQPVDIPCGQCINCRLEKSRQWAIRCVHEAQLHMENCFITLTYAPEHLPEDHSLNLKHFQDFMKRFRKEVYPKKIRFFHCGEYGEKNGRPHYHALIFGYDFPDKELIKTKDGIPLYKSDLLEKLWPFGFNTIGDVTFESAAYCARYITKKITGEASEEHYQYIDEETGESFKIKPEYTTMSRKPGIAREWFNQFKGDVYPKDFITLRGKKIKPPKFYDKILEEEHNDEYLKIKGRRKKEGKKHKEDNTFERLTVKQKIKQAANKKLVRSYEGSENET